MYATTYEIRKCKEILFQINDFIPRRYANEVIELFNKKGLKPPSKYIIHNVRHGRQYNLDIILALREIAQPRDMHGNKIESEKWNQAQTLKMFANY